MPFFSFAGLVSKAAVSKPATRLYPFAKREPYAATRGHVVIQMSSCNFCTLCAKKCPTDAIEVDRAGRVWRIDRLRCIQCRACVDACNKKSLTLDPHYSPAMTAKDVDAFKGEPLPPKPEAPTAAAPCPTP